MAYINFARKVKLSKHIIENFVKIEKELNVVMEYNEEVYSYLIKNRKNDMLRFHLSNCLIGIISKIEAFMSDILVEYITCYPCKISKGSFSNKEIFIESSNIYELANKAALKYVNELAYKKFSEYFDCFSKDISLKSKIDNKLIMKLSEIKATRDIFVHANGRCNETYVIKSGNYARAKIKEDIPLDKNYLDESLLIMKEFLEFIYNSLPESIKLYNRAKAFRDMWEYCEISEFTDFNVNVFWDINEEKDMVYPKTDYINSLSSSQKVIYDFFLSIYSYNHPKITSDIFHDSYRWSSKSKFKQVMNSWHESPFYF